MVAREDEELKGLLEKFVCVRCVQMGGVDLEIFQFDPIVSWSIFFMRADKTIYGRFGTASPHAKRNKADSNPNHTLAGLKAAMRGALDLHAAYEAEPRRWAAVLGAKTGPAPVWRFAEKTPAARKYKRSVRVRGSDTHGCVHCHETLRLAIDSYFMTGRDLPDSMLWIYPHPELVGLKLAKDHAARVEEVAAGSHAEKAGLQPGDEILAFAGQPLLSVADFQWVLHTAPDEGGALAVRVRRGDKEVDTAIQLEKLWRRKGDFGWRYRYAGYAMWLWGGVTLEDHADGVRVAQRSPGWFKKTNQDARQALKPGDVILEVDGRAGWTRSTYLAYLMREKRLGVKVSLKVRRGGEVVDLEFRIPKEQPEVQGH